MAGELKYWRCGGCGMVSAVKVRHAEYTVVACDSSWMPVEVHPEGTAAELAIFRAWKIDWEKLNVRDNELAALRRLRDRVESGALLSQLDLDSGWCSCNREAADAYRAVLLREED